MRSGLRALILTTPTGLFAALVCTGVLVTALAACGSSKAASTRSPAQPVTTVTQPGPSPAQASALSCPGAVTASEDVANVDAPTNQLLPDGARYGRLCRYYPIAGPNRPGYPHGQLEGQGALDPATLARLTPLLNGMPQDTGAAHSCPADFASDDLLKFVFASRPPLNVLSSASGCPHFTNGRFVTGRFSPQYSQYATEINTLVPRQDGIT